MTTRPVLTLRSAKAPRAPEPTPPPDQVPLERFWFIWCPTERAPKHRHATLEAARAEAARLGALAPNKEFLVYEATRVANATGDRNEA